MTLPIDIVANDPRFSAQDHADHHNVANGWVNRGEPVNGIIVPPSALMNSHPSMSAMGIANRAYFFRFTLNVPHRVRYLLYEQGLSSGNIQAGVCSLSGSDNRTLTRVVNSGIVPCPSPGNTKLDMGNSVLQAGDYALFIWASSSTAELPAQFVAHRMAAMGLATFMNMGATGIGESPFTLDGPWTGSILNSFAIGGDF